MNWYAPDTSIRNVDDDAFWKSVTWSPSLNLFVAVGFRGFLNSALSPDGQNWYAPSIPIYSVDSASFLSVAWSSSLGLFVAVGTNGLFNSAWSPDGQNWYAPTGTSIIHVDENANWNSVTWSPSLGLFVAVGDGGALNSAWSSNGKSWNPPTTGTGIVNVDSSSTWTGVSWSPSLGLFVAVGQYGSLNSAWSPDGQNWYAPSIPISSVDGADWNSVTWSPSLNLFVAVGFGGSLNSALFKKIGGDVFASNSVQTSNLFVSDAYASNSVQTTNFFATSTLISTPGSSVTTITNFEGPPRYFNSVAMDASGSNVIVTEFSTANIYTFSSITQTWSTSVIDILYINPTWVTVSGNGQVAAIDFHEASVVCLINDPFGVQTFLFSSVLTSGQPYSIALDYTGQTLVMSGGQISVLERGEFVIFPLGGADIITISGDGSTISAIYGSTLSIYFRGLEWTFNGTAALVPFQYISIASSYDGSRTFIGSPSFVVVYDQSASFVTSLTNPNEGMMGSTFGSSLSVSKDTSNVYVLDSNVGTIWSFSPPYTGSPSSFFVSPVPTDYGSGVLGSISVNASGNAFVYGQTDSGLNPSNLWLAHMTTGPPVYIQSGGDVHASNAVFGVNVFASNSVFATTYYGDGSHLTGINSLANLIVSNSVTTTNLFAYDANVSNTIFASNLYVSNIYTTNIIGFTGSQWSGTVGSTIYYLNNVGIGTSTAGSTLQVQGNVYVSNAITTTNLAASLANVTTLNVSTLETVSNLKASLANLTTLNVSTLETVSNLTASLANLTTLNVTSLGAFSNLTASLANVTTLNVSTLGIVSNLVVSNSVTTSNLSVGGNVIPVTLGNTYFQGNVVVAGNVFSSFGQLGVGGSLLFSLESPYTPLSFTGSKPPTGGLTNKIQMNSTYFTQQGKSTYVSVSANGCFQFSQMGVYTICANFLTDGNNVLGMGIGSNVIDYGTRTDQKYRYSVIPFISQNPTAILEAQFYVESTSLFYYIDAFSVGPITLQTTSNVNGGTWISVAPLGGGAAASQTITLSTLGNTVTGRNTDYDAQIADYYIGCSAGITVTLPQGLTLTAGKQYVIKDESGQAATNHITIVPYSGNLIDGQSSLTLVINYGAVSLYWTGSTWSII